MPAGSAGLAGLREVLVTAVRAFVGTVGVEDAVTLDVDAHLVESSKSTALRTHEGFRGYQPALVSWAETGLVLADQFRDGNVGAQTGLRELVDEASAALPSGRGWRVSVRSDSAAHGPSVIGRRHQPAGPGVSLTDSGHLPQGPRCREFVTLAGRDRVRHQLHSADRDFARYPELRWVDPLD